MYVYVIDRFDTPFFLSFFSTLAASVFFGEGREDGVSSLF